MSISKGLDCPECHYRNLPGARVCKICGHQFYAARKRPSINRVLEVLIVAVFAAAALAFWYGGTSQTVVHEVGSPAAPAAPVASPPASPSPPPPVILVPLFSSPETTISMASSIPTLTAVPTASSPQPTPGPDTQLAGQIRYIFNTEGQGIRARGRCDDEDGAEGWPEGLIVVVEYTYPACAGWLLVRQINGGDASWVRTGYLSDSPPAAPPTPRPQPTRAPAPVLPSFIVIPTEPPATVTPEPTLAPPTATPEPEPTPEPPTAVPTPSAVLHTPVPMLPAGAQPQIATPTRPVPTVRCKNGQVVRDEGKKSCDGKGGIR